MKRFEILEDRRLKNKENILKHAEREMAITPIRSSIL